MRVTLLWKLHLSMLIFLDSKFLFVIKITLYVYSVLFVISENSEIIEYLVSILLWKVQILVSLTVILMIYFVLRYGFCMVHSLFLWSFYMVYSVALTVQLLQYCMVIFVILFMLGLQIYYSVELILSWMISRLFCIFLKFKSLYIWFALGNLEFPDKKKNMLCIWNTSMLFIINIRNIDHKETIFLHNCSQWKVRSKTRVIMLITKKKVKITHSWCSL